MADLGDLSDFMKEGSLTDLDWLDVDEKAYRELDHLPKQNLDVVPDLEAAWGHEGKPSSAYLVPNKDVPRTMKDLYPTPAPDVVRTARVLMMQNPDLKTVMGKLLSKYGSSVVREFREELLVLAKERALLGGLYISASDFPNCHKLDSSTLSFVRKFASKAKYVVACDQCSGCRHSSGNTCAVFHKQITVDVPYTEELASEIERTQVGLGKAVTASSKSPRDRIQAALLASDATQSGLAYAKPVEDTSRLIRQVEKTGKVHLPVLSSAARKDYDASVAWSPTASAGKVASSQPSESRALGVVAFLRKELLKGRGEVEAIQALKMAFSLEDLAATRASWEPLFKEAGLFGTVYSTQDSFDDCHEGADFLARQASPVKGIVAGDRCQGCIHNKMARCLLYGRPLVASSEDLYTQEVLGQSIREYKLAGKLSSDAFFEGSVRDSLKQAYRMASTKASAPIRSYATAFAGHTPSYNTAGLTKREVVKVATRYLNEGLYGVDLLRALKSRFDPRDIKAAQEDLRSVLAEQGLQGVYYVDPSIYADYGKGCDEGARLHRARLVPYVKQASKCVSCVFQTSPGHCTKYAKPLVYEPPYTDKAAQQRDVLASGKATEVTIGSMMNPPGNILAQFEMQADLQVVVDPQASPVDVDVELGTAKVKL